MFLPALSRQSGRKLLDLASLHSLEVKDEKGNGWEIGLEQ